MDGVVKTLVIVINFMLIIPLMDALYTHALLELPVFRTCTENPSNSMTLHCYEPTLVSR